MASISNKINSNNNTNITPTSKDEDNKDRVKEMQKQINDLRYEIEIRNRMKTHEDRISEMLDNKL